MKIPMSWLANGGLWFGEGFSSKREVADFKRQVQEHVKEIDAAGLDDSVRALLAQNHLSKEQLDRGHSIALVVESALIELLETSRQLSVALEEAKAKGDMEEADRIFGTLTCNLVPRFRNKVLSMMDALKKDDHRALHLTLRAVDNVEVLLKAADAA